ncbi:MAG: hypothetical protein IPN86_06380 [Saprospiraceae bacterium]|nr:hypothetical protein [Saprospiraceae bacterium]
MKHLYFLILFLPYCLASQVSLGVQAYGSAFKMKNTEKPFLTLKESTIYKPIVCLGSQFHVKNKSEISINFDWSSFTIEGEVKGQVYYPPSGITFDRHNVGIHYLYAIYPKIYLGFGYQKSFISKYYFIDYYLKANLSSSYYFDIDIISINLKYNIFKQFTLNGNINKSIKISNKFPNVTEFSYIQLGLGYALSLKK